MTTAPQHPGRLTTAVERSLCGMAWATQAGAAGTYLVIAAQPSAWRSMLARDQVSTICMGLIALCMAGLWAVCLWAEQGAFYNRFIRRSSRRAGLFGHLSVLLIAVLVASSSRHRIGLWAVIGILCFSAVVSWAVWMESRLLPDEDQAVIDAILSREAEQRAAAHDASEREKRRVRLAAIVEGLGYALTDADTQTDKPAEAPAVRWPIPSGKHAPLVYFIRNGNRMKIGTTVELKRRIRTLALRPENVTLLVDGDQRRERAFHKQFAEHRIGNTEWFAYEGTLADHVHAELTRIAKKGREQ